MVIVNLLCKLSQIDIIVELCQFVITCIITMVMKLRKLKINIEKLTFYNIKYFI
jgi:hypothetical protein